MTPKPPCCFICEKPVRVWHPPYVELGVDGYGQPAWAHFVCYTNALTPLVQNESERVTIVEPVR